MTDQSYQLTVDWNDRASTSVFVPMEDRTLGDIELQPTGEVIGDVLLPPDVAPEQIRMRLLGFGFVTLDGDSTFHLPAIIPGTYQVAFNSIPGKLERISKETMAHLVIKVDAGKVSNATIDLRPLGTNQLAQLHIDVKVGGEPVQGITVMSATPGTPFRTPIGETDREGRIRVPAPKGPFELWSRGAPISETVYEVQRQDTLVIPLEMAHGVRVIFPNDFKVSNAGRLLFKASFIESDGSQRGRRSRTLDLSEDLPAKKSRVSSTESKHPALELNTDERGKSIFVPHVFPGEFQLVLSVFGEDHSLPKHWTTTLAVKANSVATWDLRR